MWDDDDERAFQAALAEWKQQEEEKDEEEKQQEEEPDAEEQVHGEQEFNVFHVPPMRHQILDDPPEASSVEGFTLQHQFLDVLPKESNFGCTP